MASCVHTDAITLARLNCSDECLDGHYDIECLNLLTPLREYSNIAGCGCHALVSPSSPASSVISFRFVINLYIDRSTRVDRTTLIVCSLACCICIA
jgi:hypothetical protein